MGGAEALEAETERLGVEALALEDVGRGRSRPLRALPGRRGQPGEDGCRAAAAHDGEGAIQLHADGPHDPADVKRFAEAIRAHPGGLVLGIPIFDAGVPRARFVIERVRTGDRSELEPETAVRSAAVVRRRARAARESG